MATLAALPNLRPQHGFRKVVSLFCTVVCPHRQREDTATTTLLSSIVQKALASFTVYSFCVISSRFYPNCQVTVVTAKKGRSLLVFLWLAEELRWKIPKYYLYKEIHSCLCPLNSWIHVWGSYLVLLMPWLLSCSEERGILGPGWVGCGMCRFLIFSRWISDTFKVGTLF